MEILIIAFVILLFILLYNLLKWRPVNGKWYRNKKWDRLFGHEVHKQNCYIIINNKKMRGSFRVKESKVEYLIGWHYHRNKIKAISKWKCSFYKSSKHIPLQGQGTNEYFIKTYILKIR
jgi:hypothetical protein